MSVAIVCMINNTRLEENNQKTPTLEVSKPSQANTTLIDQQKCAFDKLEGNLPKDGPFDFDKPTQGLILSSFFYGYLLTQIIGAGLAVKFGPKIVLEISILIGSIFTLLTPLSARLDWSALILCRFFIGLSHGVVWPALMAIWPFWAPPSERSTLLGFSNAGSQIGNVITLPMGGFLCDQFENGWAYTFYIIGKKTLKHLLNIRSCFILIFQRSHWYLLVYFMDATHSQFA